MNSRKLVVCCILGIVLGYIAPFVLNVNRSTSLSIGMVAGLGIGYLLDMLDEKKNKAEDTVNLSRKAREANQLMAKARAEISGKALPEADAPEADEPEEERFDEKPQAGSDFEEEAAKLNEAEEMIRKARERIR